MVQREAYEVQEEDVTGAVLHRDFLFRVEPAVQLGSQVVGLMWQS